MKTFISSFIVILFLFPLGVLAQMSTSTGSGISISSTLVEQIRNLDGEEIKHAPVSLHLGVRKRFSSSQADVAELAELTPELVLNNQLLELYVRKMVLTEPIKSLNVGESEVAASLKGPARLLGFIPVRTPYEVIVAFEGAEITDITSESTAWWSFLAQEKSSGEIDSSIRAHLEGRSYLSRIQLRAFILEAIVQVVSS